MRESLDHYRWRHDGQPDRYHDVDVFNVDPDTADHINVRTARFTNHGEAERWLIAHLTTTRPFGQGRTYLVDEVDHVELGHGLTGLDVVADEPDGWCYLDNAATQFDREGDWLPYQRHLDLGIDFD